MRMVPTGYSRFSSTTMTITYNTIDVQRNESNLINKGSYKEVEDVTLELVKRWIAHL